MKYRKIDEDWRYEITGNRKGCSSVQIKDKKSFINQGQRSYFESFMMENFSNTNRIYVENFQTFDARQCPKIHFFPKGKRIKEIDVMAYGPQYIGTDFLVSEKCWKVLDSFNLPPYNKILAEIDTFSSRYYLIGFGKISDRKIDLSKSAFYDSSGNKYKKLIYKNYDELNAINVNREAENLILLDHYDFDVISIVGQGIFFSENLIKKIEDEHILGLSISDTTLEC